MVACIDGKREVSPTDGDHLDALDEIMCSIGLEGAVSPANGPKRSNSGTHWTARSTRAVPLL